MTVSIGMGLYKVTDLLLDARNPRLSPDSMHLSQDELLILLDENFNLDQLAMSMADNGYFEEEPLIGVVEEGEIYIVEGNRRLATLKLLTSEHCRSITRRTEMWGGFAQLSLDNNYDLTEVPVVIHETREEIMAILGQRHISGPLRWDPLPKSRYIDGLISSLPDDINFYYVGRKIGYKQDFVRRNYVAYRALIQAKEAGIYTENVEHFFGKFYTALNNSDIKTYLGLEIEDKLPIELKYPILKENLEKLSEVIEYIHGSKDKTPVFSDSRRISDLGQILMREEARSMLFTARNFTAALRLTGGEEIAILNNLEEVDVLLRQAYQNLDKYIENLKIHALIDACHVTITRMKKVYDEQRNS